MAKRKAEYLVECKYNLKNCYASKKHTLDSDEEDSDQYDKHELKDSDIEGGEEGVVSIEDDVRITPFNMREELEEGHFDKEGHYHWKKNSDIKDNWLDNIDMIKVKSDKKYNNTTEDEHSNSSSYNCFNEVKAYTHVLKIMKPQETVQKTFQRLGRNRKKMSSAERLKQKKNGIVDNDSETITNFTEIIHEILTKMGNTDIYEESYEHIENKIKNLPCITETAYLVESFDFEVKGKPV